MRHEAAGAGASTELMTFSPASPEVSHSPPVPYINNIKKAPILQPSLLLPNAVAGKWLKKTVGVTEWEW